MKRIIFILIFVVILTGCISSSSSLIHSNERAISNRVIKIEELLNSGNVNLLIIMPKNEVTHNINTDPEYIDWVNRTRQGYVSDIMSALLEYFKSYENFKIVDRQLLDTIIDEQEFSLSNLVNNDTRIRIGNITGANYIFFITYNRYMENVSNTKVIKTDTIIHKFISIETGEVIAVDIYKTIFTSTYFLGTWNHSTKSYNNNREIVRDERDDLWYYK